jgi:hypothetical protein
VNFRTCLCREDEAFAEIDALKGAPVDDDEPTPAKKKKGERKAIEHLIDVLTALCSASSLVTASDQ